MTIQLDPPVEARLREAAATRGMGTDEYASRLIAEHLPPPSMSPAERAAKLREVFARWALEECEDDPKEIARREDDWREFKELMTRSGFDLDGPLAGSNEHSNQATLDLFKQWDAEDAKDATDDPVELAKRRTAAEQFMRNLAQNRIDMEGPHARRIWP